MTLLPPNPNNTPPVEGVTPVFEPAGISPLRSEIEALLMFITTGSTLDVRNAARKNQVAAWFDKYFPGQLSMKQSIMDDLESYNGWEHA